MLGAVIGDLAAWTFEHDRVLFYRQLLSKQAELSVFGHAFMKACSHNIINDERILAEPMGSPANVTIYGGQHLMWMIVEAWFDNKPLRFLPQFYSLEKESYYAVKYIKDIIKLLKEGKTKSETFHAVGNAFQTIIKSWEWKNECKADSLLKCVFRAWDSFYRAFDFTSSMHNAMRWTDHRQLTAVLTGAFASAMYGCEYGFIKAKYASTYENMSFNLLQLLSSIIETKYDYHHYICTEASKSSNEQRVFFPKNNSLTNVERHTWRRIKNLFDKEALSNEEKDKLLRAGYTGWDNRYGLYLDDGKVYLYRSGCLLGRFTLARRHKGDWCICEIELSGEKDYKLFWIGMEEALNGTCGINKESYREAAFYAYECKYYKGEYENPYKNANSNESRFWHGEMMFMTEIYNKESWAKLSEGYPENEPWAKHLSKAQCTMWNYIESLYGKWCPMEDNSWLSTY